MPVLRDRAPEGHLILSGIRWSTYEALLDDLKYFPGVRVAYDRGTLEIMSPSKLHERLKKLIGRLLEALTEELNIEIQSAGSTTWKRVDLERGFEPDECYYITNVLRVRNKDHADLLVDPPPDLAIEVDLARVRMSKLGIYAALGIPEAWRYDGERFQIFLLQSDRSYQEASTSANLPFLPLDELAVFLSRRNQIGETQLIREFRRWVRASLGQHTPP